MKNDLAIDQSDLTDRCYERLKQLILTREFPPNEKLSIDRLAERLGVSRTPVKDALHRLAADGLVTISRRVGSFVTPLTYKDVKEVFTLRLLFELHAAEQGIERATPSDIARMRGIVTGMAGCIEANRYRPADYDRFISADHALHRAIIDLAENDRLTQMYEDLNVHVRITRAYYVKELGNAAQGQEEHSTIVAAYEQRDLALLKRVLEAHITTVRNLVIENLRAMGGVL